MHPAIYGPFTPRGYPDRAPRGRESPSLDGARPSLCPHENPMRLAPSWLLLCTLPLSACIDGGDKGDDSAGDTGGALNDGGGGIDPLLHECVSYEPQVITGEINDVIGADATLVAQAFVAPPDRQTGLLVMQLTAPGLNPDDDLLMGISTNGPEIGIDDYEDHPRAAQAEISAAIAITPGVEVQLTVNRYAAPPDTATSVLAPWVWTETMDCYEPNNSVEQAKHVPTGVQHSAWMISGVGDDPTIDDWYRFTLTEDSVVRLQVAGPDTLPVGFSLAPLPNPEADPTALGQPVGELLYSDPFAAIDWTSEAPLPAGTYALRLVPFVSLGEVDLPELREQKHMWAGYTFQIDATPAR